MDSSRRGSWNETQSHRGKARVARDSRRVAIGVSMLILFAWLVYLLFPPFFAPRTHLVLLGCENESPGAVPPMPYAMQDRAALTELSSVTVHDASKIWRSARDVKALSQRLESISVSGQDRLMVFVRAHGIAVDGQAYLLCDNFDLRRPDQGRVLLRDVLQSISESVAGTKLILLSLGDLGFDPRLGMMADAFPERLAEAVAETRDSNLWVYCSHSAMETSHVSTVAERSLFDMLIEAGLSGDADQDRDQSVSLGELVSYTTANVSGWVRQSTGGSASQTPTVFWGGAESGTTSSDPTLVHVLDSSQNTTRTARRFFIDAPSAVSSEAADATVTQVSLAGDAAAGKESTDGASDTTSSFAKSLRQLDSAWQLRDHLKRTFDPDSPSVNPVAAVPHRWAQFESQLLAAEQRLLFGMPWGEEHFSEAVNSALEYAFDPAKEIPETIRQALVPKSRPAVDLLESFDEESIHSLALAKLFTAGWETEPDDQIIEWIESGTRAQVDAWLKANADSKLLLKTELALLEPLLATKDLAWREIQMALRTHVLGERTAALDFRSIGSVRSQVLKADRHRLLADQMLIQRPSSDWRRRAAELYRAATETYEAAEQTWSTVRHAQVLRDRVICELSWYVRSSEWVIRDGNDEWSQNLVQLIDQLQRLAVLLGENRPVDPAELASLHRLLSGSRTRVLMPISDDAASALLARAPTPGDGWRSRCLLRTPLVSSSYRTKLIASQRERETELSSDYRLATDDDQRDIREQWAEPGLRDKMRDWELRMSRARIEAAVIALCVPNNQTSNIAGDEPFVSDKIPDGLAAHANAVLSSLDRLEKHWKDLRSRATTSSNKRDVSKDVDAEMWSAFDDLGRSVKSFYQSIRMPSDPSLLCQPGVVHESIRQLQQLDARDAWKFYGTTVPGLSARLRLVSTLKWQAERLGQFANIDVASECEAYRKWIDAYQFESARLAGLSPRPRMLAARMELEPAVDLRYHNEGQSELRITNTGKQPLSGIVSVTFDRQLVDLALGGGWSTDQVMFDSSDQFRLRLDAGNTIRIPMRIRRIGNATESNQVIFNLFDQDSKQTLIASRSMMVRLPFAEVAIHSGNVDRISGGDQLHWYPLANRTEKLDVGLVNLGRSEKSIRVACFAIDRDIESSQLADLPPDWIAGQKALLGFDASVAPNGVPVYPAVKPTKDGESKKPTGSDKPKTEAQPPAAPDAKPITSLPHGMLAVLTDLDSGEQINRAIKFSVPRPESVVAPRVSYDAADQTIHVEATAIDPSRLPEGPPIHLRLRVAGMANDSLNGVLEGTLSRQHPKAMLSARVTRAAPDRVTVYIDVDGFERAFAYQISTTRNMASVPVVQSGVQAKLGLAPSAGTSVGSIVSAQPTIPLTVAIDAAGAAMAPEQNYFVIGVDADQDGEPDPATLVRLDSDRDVCIAVMKATPEGSITLRTRVSDFKIALPASRYKNMQVNVASQWHLAGQVDPSPPLALFIDAAAPEIGPVTQSAPIGLITPKAKLRYTIWCWDAVSGIRNLDAVLVDGKATEFPAEAKAVQGRRTGKRQWEIELQAGEAAGSKTLLIRATDGVGNVSDAVAIDVQVVSLTSPAANQAKLHAVTGKVSYREKPIDSAEIELSSMSTAPGKSKLSKKTTTKADGSFTLSGVKPGQYQLVARGVIRNRVKSFQTKIVVTPGPGKTIRVDAILD